MKKIDKGFTLTELLVVIAIIGILAGLILVSGGAARRDARDRRRKADVEQIVGLLQVRAVQIKLTFANAPRWIAPEHNDSYLGVINGWDVSSTGAGFLDFGSSLNLVAEGYTTQVPRDPINAGETFYRYAYFRQGETAAPAGCTTPFFVVIAELEGEGNGHCGFAGSTGRGYAVTGR